jgi:hypothetical protein
MRSELYINRPIDFNSLTPREFEEVIYLYFKDQIKKGLYKGNYDDVQLSSGIGDKGADILLFFNGKVNGIVQCKKYSKNLDKKTILTEIVRFLLYDFSSKINNEKSSYPLIHDIETFTYHIAVSKDFTQEAKIFIADFNNISKKEDIQSIVLGELNKPSFKHLELHQVIPNIHELLSQLNLSPLTAVDIDPIIRSNIDIINRYFTTLSGLETSSTPKRENQNIYSRIANGLSDRELKVKAEYISNDINRVKTYFGTKQDLFIERHEVDEVLKWTRSTLAKDQTNIAIIAGNAGMGKSVVMSQLHKKLLKENIPVVSLKADKLTFNSSKELEEAFDLNIRFETFMDQLVINKQIGVLLIDQIDALSQALSSDFKPLNFYDRLIQKFIHHPKIKIVVSTRIYDLNYDPIISNYRGKKSFTLKPLGRDSLLEILKRSSVKNYSQFNDSFMNLISTPLHLDIFLKVYTPKLNTDEITSLQGLYSILWSEKVVNNIKYNLNNLNIEKIAELIFGIASMMYEKQKISIDKRLFEDKFSPEIKYLKAEGILKTSDQIEFFHQSFFDYSFARNFINDDSSLKSHVLQKHQGLFIRSKIKQVLNYARSVDEEKYISEVTDLISHDDIRFHIKLLTLQQIAFQINPSILERRLFKRAILSNELLENSFLALYLGEGWISFFIQEDIFTKQIENDTKEENKLLIDVFNRFRYSGDKKQLLEYYKKLKNSDTKDQLIIEYLWRVSKAESQLAIELIELVLSRRPNYRKEYWYYRILENTVLNFPHWVKDQILTNLDIKKGTDINDERNYFYTRNHAGKIFDDFWEVHPDIAYDLVKEIIKEILVKRSYDNKKTIIADSAFLTYNRKNLDLYKHYDQMDKLQTYLEDKYNRNPDFVRKEVSTFLMSDYVTELMVGFSILFKYKEEFKEEAYLFFSNLDRFVEIYGVNEYLKFMMLEVFGSIYGLISEEKKEYLNNVIIEKFHRPYEMRVFKDDEGKPMRNKFYGIGKYELLTSIIQMSNLTDEKLLREYKELKRKFGEVNNKEPEGVKVHVNRDPLNADYFKFTLKNWENSFKTYSFKNKNYDGWNQPTEFEHGRRFAEVVSRNPSEFIDFTKKLIFNTQISNTYIVKALEGLKDGKLIAKELVKLFCLAIEKREFDKVNTLYLIWLTRYFAENKLGNEKVFSFLKHNLANGDEGKKDPDDILMNGINSVRGAAASTLIDFAYSEENFEFIFSALKLLINNSSPSTRASAVHKMQYLLRFGQDRVMNLFLELSNDYHPGILKASINPLQYLINHDFEALIPFFKASLKVQESSDEIGQLITAAYCRNYKESSSLIDEFLEHHKPNIVVKIAFEFIEHESQIKEALSLIERFYVCDNQELGSVYNQAFFHMKPELFLELKEFLFEYAHSNIGKYREYAYFDFLLKCAKKHPEDCIELSFIPTNSFKSKYEDDNLTNKQLQVIISSYNTIREYEKENSSLKKAMDLFDNILQSERYRNSSAHMIMNDVDSY